MELQTDGGELLLAPGLTSKQLGGLAEQDLDRVILLHSGGRLHPYIPMFDTRKVDRAYAYDGIDAVCFLQAKARTGPDRDGRYHWQVKADHFKPYRKLWLVLATIDPKEAKLSDPIWLVRSSDVDRVGVHSHNDRGSVLDLQASPTGHDALSAYRTTRSELTRKLVPRRRLEAPARVEFPALREEQGAFYEVAHIAEDLRASQDDLLIYRPAQDIAGRDLMVQLVDTPRVLFWQVKGTSVVLGDSLHLVVLTRTFTPRHNFWLAFYYYDRERGALFEDCWLVPSLEFARRKRQLDQEVLVFEPRLSREHDRWAEFRHPFRAQGDVLRQALHALPDNESG